MPHPPRRQTINLERTNREEGLALTYLRRQNAAWQLLASPRAPLIVACLRALLDSGDGSTAMETMEQSLADMLAEHANDEEFAVGAEFLIEARRELRDWIKRRLVVERGGQLIATDDLQRVLTFVDGIQDRVMTSTASRLATVQREIDNLAVRLNPQREVRAKAITAKISELQAELSRVERGEFEVLEGDAAREGIREVYDLAISLRADFRRVEDSYRAADHALRQSIISDGHHRGQIVDKLLDSHDELLQTPEGLVFTGFHQQLTEAIELERMKLQLKEIGRAAVLAQALNRQQQMDLTWLTMRLVRESKSVIRARARSERDVKGFIKTGLAAEHHRVGQLLNDILEAALAVDWTRQVIRRDAAPLPCIAVATGTLPLIQRLLVKSAEEEEHRSLSLQQATVDLDDIDEDFWTTFDTLDRRELFESTLRLLRQQEHGLSVGTLAGHLAAGHDLESIAYWLGLAREADITFDTDLETFELQDTHEHSITYRIPRVTLTASALESLHWEVS